MARNFDGVDDEIDCGSGTSIDNIYAAGGTNFTWVRAESAGQGAVGRIADKRADIPDRGCIHAFVSDLVSGALKTEFLITWTTIARWATTNRDLVINIWDSVGITYSSTATTNDPIIYIGGSSKAITEVNTPTGTVSTDADVNLVIGDDTTSIASFDGDLSYHTQWTVILTATEIAALGRGVNPFVIRNGNQVFFMPIWGNDSPERDESGNNNDGTVLGTTKSTSNPPVELMENYI